MKSIQLNGRKILVSAAIAGVVSFSTTAFADESVAAANIGAIYQPQTQSDIDSLGGVNRLGEQVNLQEQIIAQWLDPSSVDLSAGRDSERAFSVARTASEPSVAEGNIRNIFRAYTGD